MRANWNRTWIVAVALGAAMAFTGQAQARGGRGWVPQPAWDAVKQRASTDLGTSQVKLYKNSFSGGLTRGLKGNLGTISKAYVVHARTVDHSVGRTGTTKRRGPYLAVKSNQGIWEAFPLALAAQKTAIRPQQGRHITNADGRKPENNTYAFADGLLGGTKVVQAVKAKNSYWTSTVEGQIVASKGRGSTKTLFILGDPNRQGSDPAAYSQIKLHSFRLPRGERDMPPHPDMVPGSPLRTKFINVPQPAIGLPPPVASR